MAAAARAQQSAMPVVGFLGAPAPGNVAKELARRRYVNQCDAKFSPSSVQSIMLRQCNPLCWRSWLSMRMRIMRGLFGTAFLLISTACFAADYIPPGELGETPPGYGGPAYGPPAYGGPVYGGPGYDAPAYDAPVYGGPVYGGPVYGGPVYGRPAYGAPVYGGPVYGAPVYGGPVYGGPVYRGPIYSGPAYGAPVYRGPVYGGPVYGVMPPY